MNLHLSPTEKWNFLQADSSAVHEKAARRELHVKLFASCIHVWNFSTLNLVKCHQLWIPSSWQLFGFFLLLLLLLKISQNLCCRVGSVNARMERLDMRICHKRTKAWGYRIIFGHINWLWLNNVPLNFLTLLLKKYNVYSPFSDMQSSCYVSVKRKNLRKN